MPVPAAVAIDISMCGMLLAFDEPGGCVVGDRMVVSLELTERKVHVLGRSVRVERGSDLRSYVAIEFDSLHEDDEAALSEFLETAVRDASSPA